MSEMNNTPPEIIPGDRHPDYKGEIAALLRGKTVAPGVSLSISPGSKQVLTRYLTILCSRLS